MSLITIYCKIKAIDEGQYTLIVVEDLNRDYSDDLKYVTVVKLPNWDSKMFQVGDIGFLQLENVVGGETTYFNRSSNEINTYIYTNNYFLNFIKERDKCEQEKFKF